jgi:hypothetical protein
LNDDAMPVITNRDLIRALNVDWARQRLAPASSTIRSWQATDPALAQLDTLVDIEAAASRVGANDATLAALLRLAQAGDKLAARLLLQVLLGVAVRLAARTVHHTRGDLEEARSRAVEALWQCIHRYPVDRRHGRHADQIALDTLAILVARPNSPGNGQIREHPLGTINDQGWTANVRTTVTGDWDHYSYVHNATYAKDIARGTTSSIHLMERHPGVQDDLDIAARGEFWAAAGTGTAPTCSDQELIELLAWAVRQKVIKLHEAQLLLRRYCPDEPGRQPPAENVAHDLGINSAALRQRTSRIVQRLTAAVRSANAGSASTPQLEAA